MNYDIKNEFTALDLEVGDLMYDAKEEGMVKVVFVHNTVQENVLAEGPLEIKQIVFERLEDGIVFLITVVGKRGVLPRIENGKPRFRHLIKVKEPFIINLPECPRCPVYPLYPTYPTWPYDPNPLYPYSTPTWPSYPDYILCDGTTSISDNGDCTEFDTTSNIQFNNNVDEGIPNVAVTWTINIEDKK